MLENMAGGGAAISVLARELNAELQVICLGVAEPIIASLPFSPRLGPGTANFVTAPAMTRTQLARALDAGRDAVTRACDAGATLLVTGEIGIANTTSAAALGCALLQLAPAKLAGPGSGLDASGVAHKAAVIARALDLHMGALHDSVEALRRLGGFELAALAGAAVAAAQSRLPVLVDGFAASVAALAAVRLNPPARNWLLFGHRSAEPGHRYVLDALHARPLLDLNMRLGEGTGAAMAVPLLQLALTLHCDMATFAESGVPPAQEGDGC